MKVQVYVKLVPEKSDTMDTEDVLREIVAYTESMRDLYNRDIPGYRLYLREDFLKFCDTILSLVKQEVY